MDVRDVFFCFFAVPVVLEGSLQTASWSVSCCQGAEVAPKQALQGACEVRI